MFFFELGFVNVLFWKVLFVVFVILLECRLFFFVELNGLYFILLKLGFYGNCDGFLCF